MSDKQSKEKMDISRCWSKSSGVSYRCWATDPRSYYSVSKTGEETPNSWYVNQ
jgi:hypothetical protein